MKSLISNLCLNKSSADRFWLVSMFAIAMAFLESAVVIYLRHLYYPEGFDFPMNEMDVELALVELIREFATLVMLVSIAMMAAKKGVQRFGFFLIAFAIWDIFYYVFLKAFLNWPSDVLTWDILFLLPTVWVGPVIAPIILSVLMIVFGRLLIKTNQQQQFAVSKREWAFLIGGSLVVILSFTEEFVWKFLFSSRAESLLEFAHQFIPQHFNWPIYLVGIMGILYAITSYHFRYEKTKKVIQHAQLF